ncbi:serine hydrolase domain-containing protein [Streptomyces sp. NPDC097619]|uniref:serine hydrolase domain-containing protein n=1 Tax=Streptomyces sp. NPDC097619 TaxID=3157228 RepID=UPI0033212F3F
MALLPLLSGPPAGSSSSFPGGGPAPLLPGSAWAFGDRAGVRGLGAAPDLPEGPESGFALDGGPGGVVTVWAAAGVLAAEGTLRLHTPLGRSWTALSGHPLAAVTPHHLLTHTAGLPCGGGAPDPLAVAVPVRPPSRAVEYSEHGIEVLGLLLEHLAGRPAVAVAAERVWGPLGMTGTSAGADGGPVRSRLSDLARFLHGTLAADPVGFGPGWVYDSLRIRTGELAPPRGLCWYPAPGTAPGRGLWAHHGRGGSGLWLHPAQGTWAVLLAPPAPAGPDGGGPAAVVRDSFRRALFG